MPEETLSSLRRCTVLVILGSLGAGQSDAVAQEIQAFLPTHRSVVPVTFGESIRTAKWYHMVEGLPLAREEASALAAVAPSPRLIGRVVNAHGFVSRNRRLRRVFWSTCVAIAALVAAGGLLVRSIEAKRRAAELRRERAEVAARQSEVATQAANEQRANAERQAQVATEKANVEAARAAKRQAVSVAQRLAAEAPGFQAINRLDERAALLARQAFLLNAANDGEALGEVDQALRRVLGWRGFSVNLGRISSPYSALAFDGDDLIMAFGASVNQTTLMVERVRGAQVRTVLEQRAGGRVLNLALRRDGKRLVYFVDEQARDGQLRLLDLGARRPRTSILEPALDSLRSLAFSPDGELVIAGSDDGTLRIWNVAADTPRMLFSPIRLPGGVTAVAVSADARIAAAGTAEGALMTIDLLSPDPQPIAILDGACAAATRWITSLAFAPDGAILAGEAPLHDEAEPAPPLRRWPLGRPAACPEAVPGAADWPQALAFTPEGDRLIAATVNGALQVWRYSDLAQAPDVFEGPIGATGGLGISATGSHAASTDVFGEVRIWALTPSPAEPRLLGGFAAAIKALAIAPASGLLAGCDGSGDIRSWQLDALEREPRVVSGAEGDCAAMALMPDGSRLAVAYRHAFEGPPRAVRLWDLRNGGATAPLIPPGGETWAEAVAFGPSGDRLAWATADGIAVWDLRDSSSVPKRLAGSADRTTAVAWVGHGLIASGSTDGTVRLWNPAGNSSRIIGRHADVVRAIAVSPSGEWLASASRSGSMMLQTIAGSSVPRRWPGHDGDISALSFTADGKSVLSAGSDGAIRLWPVPPDREPLTIRTGAPVTAAALSADSSWIAAGTRGGSIALHPTSTQRLADAVCQLVRRNLSATEWAAHVGATVPYECTCPRLPPGLGAATCATGTGQVAAGSLRR